MRCACSRNCAKMQRLHWRVRPEQHGRGGQRGARAGGSAYLFVLDEVRYPVPVAGGGRSARREYILALAILDPAGNLPSVRFATTNYFRGGRHPIGWIGVGRRQPKQRPLPAFDDPAQDHTLHYDV